MSGLLVQNAVGRGTRPRLPVAYDQGPHRTRSHLDLQPLVLRRSFSGASTSRDPGAPTDPGGIDGPQALGAALRRYGRVRAASGAQWHGGAQVLFACFARGTA